MPAGPYMACMSGTREATPGTAAMRCRTCVRLDAYCTGKRGCEVRLCDPCHRVPVCRCAPVRAPVCVPCVSRVSEITDTHSHSQKHFTHQGGSSTGAV